MSKFKDRTGQEWELILTVGSIQRIEDATGFNIVRDYTDSLENLIVDSALTEVTAADVDRAHKPYREAMKNPVVVTKMVFAACELQARERKIGWDAFMELFDRDAYDAAFIAMQEAIVNFTQKGQREVMKKALAVYTAMKAKVAEEAEQRAKTMTGEELNGEQAPSAGANAGSSVESAGSIPAPSVGSS